MCEAHGGNRSMETVRTQLQPRRELANPGTGMEVSREGVERCCIIRAMDGIVLPNGREVRELQMLHWQRTGHEVPSKSVHAARRTGG